MSNLGNANGEIDGFQHTGTDAHEWVMGHCLVNFRRLPQVSQIK